MPMGTVLLSMSMEDGNLRFGGSPARTQGALPWRFQREERSTFVVWIALFGDRGLERLQFGLSPGLFAVVGEPISSIDLATGQISHVLSGGPVVAPDDLDFDPNGTAFVTDLGMTGPVNSIIGSRVEDVLTRFLTAMPRRLNVADKGPLQFNSVFIEIDDLTGLATEIHRVDRTFEL